jgi:endonuclease III
MLVCPGNANISALEIIPVAVDVHVRRVTEYLGVTNTRMEELENVREKIQQSWAEDVRKHGAEGPGQLANTSSAVDPALWFFGKWGCAHCEKSRRRIPIADVCGGCRFDHLNPGGVVEKSSGRGSCG